MKIDCSMRSLSCLAVTLFMAVGFTTLLVKLYFVQIDDAAHYKVRQENQSIRTIMTAGSRGSILDRRCNILAENKTERNLVAFPEFFQKRTFEKSISEIIDAMNDLARVIGRPPDVTAAQIKRHIREMVALPLTVWKVVSDEELARFYEQQEKFPGFACETNDRRIYPQGSLAAHVLGRVGLENVKNPAGSPTTNFQTREMRGREGLEWYYDTYLRGAPGEDRVLVDARGYASRRWTVSEPRRGPNLILNLDQDIQRAVESELAGRRGAMVVMDAEDGAILALASAPTFNPNDCSPIFPEPLYEKLRNDQALPLFNRATFGQYPPGSTFKIVTSLAALENGLDPNELYDCEGVFGSSLYRIRCIARWGHGLIDLPTAIQKSCNPFFCHLAMNLGTNALITAAHNLGLSSRTGIDFPTDAEGVVPNDAWKQAHYEMPWVTSDLVQMSIGQGMLLVTPIQMVRLVAAVATGTLVVPRLNREQPIGREELVFSEANMAIVRDGMHRVVKYGSGRRGGEGVHAHVIGKTGTAEVGPKKARKKQAWFVAAATGVPLAKFGFGNQEKQIAVACVVEDGEGGGLTAAPRVGKVLKAIFGERTREDEEKGEEIND